MPLGDWGMALTAQMGCPGDPHATTLFATKLCWVGLMGIKTVLNVLGTGLGLFFFSPDANCYYTRRN